MKKIEELVDEKEYPFVVNKVSRKVKGKFIKKSHVLEGAFIHKNLTGAKGPIVMSPNYWVDSKFDEVLDWFDIVLMFVEEMYSEDDFELPEYPISETYFNELMTSNNKFYSLLKKYAHDDTDMHILISSAKSLGFSDVVKIAGAWIADKLLRDKSPEQIRELYGITNDFTPEEEQKIRDANKWVAEDEIDEVKKLGPVEIAQTVAEILKIVQNMKQNDKRLELEIKKIRLQGLKQKRDTLRQLRLYDEKDPRDVYEGLYSREQGILERDDRRLVPVSASKKRLGKPLTRYKATKLKALFERKRAKTNEIDSLKTQMKGVKKKMLIEKKRGLLQKKLHILKQMKRTKQHDEAWKGSDDDDDEGYYDDSEDSDDYL